MLRTSLLRFVFLAVLASTSASAATVTKLADDALAPLRSRTAGKKVVVDRLPLYDAERSVIELEEFEVWAPGAKVIIHGESGVTHADPPAARFFRGLVNSDPESFAYFSIDAKTKRIEGLIVIRERKFALASARRADKTIPQRSVDPTEGFDYFLTEADEADMAATTDRTWQCDVDKMEIDVPTAQLRATGTDGLPVTAHGISGTQSYAITLEIQTDHEYYINSGSNTTVATDYATNLVGALSTIYNRDLKTNVVLGAVNLWTTASDPWTTTNAGVGMEQLGDYYHNVFSASGFPNTTGRTTSAVAMLSGKDVPSGIAWRGVICGSDFFQSSHWGGPYSWNGGIGLLFDSSGFGDIPDPNAVTNGALYGMPTGGRNYWPLAQLTHELGHNMGSKHTHCMTLTPAEQTATGRMYVDNCYNAEGGCFSATETSPTERGTIMSYCHNIFGAGGVPQSRFVFGLPSEVSQHVLDDYLLREDGPVSGFNNIVNGVGTFSISAITAPASVPASSAGNSASISPSAGTTYAWTITNGTITGGQGTNAITFAAGASGTVALRATAYNSTRCGVTDTKSVTIGGGAVAPTNVVATATGLTSVAVTWTAVGGASGYRVYRSDGTGYVEIGTPATNSFTDNAASTNKAYLYRVRAVSGGVDSPDSAADFATVITYTDPTVTPGSTAVKVAHFTELRQAAVSMRILANLGTTTFTDPVLSSAITVKAAHIDEIRSHLNLARTTLGYSAVAFTDPTVTAGSTTIKAAHITELRAGAQ